MGIEGTIIYVVVIAAALYLLIIRPNQQRRKQMQELIEALAPGKRVMTAGGILGSVLTVGDDTVTIEVARDVVMEFDKQAIARVIDDEADDA